MQFHQLDDKNTVLQTILTFGNFDGVHLGHNYLIKHLISLANKEMLQSVLMTFDPHTNTILSNNNFKVITPFKNKKEILSSYNFDILCRINFNKEFSKLNADQFMDIIIKKYNPKIILIGYDNFFGYKKSGSFKFLKNSNKYKHINILTLDQYNLNGENIKSSIIKNMLLNNNITKVNNFIKRSYSMDGKVIRGEKLSKLTGFHTANIKLANNEQLIPGNGVYSVTLLIDSNKYLSVCNIGYCPTIKNSKTISIEVHVIDEEFDIYNKNVTIYFNSFIRNEKKFLNINDLKIQILKDIESVKERKLNSV